PIMVKVHQHFDSTRIDQTEIRQILRDRICDPAIKRMIRPDMNIALAVGSRGIRHLDFIVRTVVDILREMGAKPFIVPSMGSHGGATPEGQKGVLRHYGITEETMGIPIEASMETLELGVVDDVPVYISRPAYESDLIIPICRVKPHTDFKGRVESGI
ncbi:DUF362 domain-containing protein, partial [Anoxybacillus sp. LAT_38]|nr:DUF362 domain-containing protein [Anoxybacillus sp. LAT_38]